MYLKIFHVSWYCIIIGIFFMSFQKPYKPEEYKSLIEKNFSEIWFQFLYFEVMRSRDCIRFMSNNPNGYLILQVICWHHGLILWSENKNQNRINNEGYTWNETRWNTNSMVVNRSPPPRRNRSAMSDSLRIAPKSERSLRSNRSNRSSIWAKKSSRMVCWS